MPTHPRALGNPETKMLTKQRFGISPTESQAALQARRVNTQMAAVVDKGIQLQEVFGTKFAADYLSFHKVSIDVTVRVLTKPNERRAEPVKRKFLY